MGRGETVMRLPSRFRAQVEHLNGVTVGAPVSISSEICLDDNKNWEPV